MFRLPTRIRALVLTHPPILNVPNNISSDTRSTLTSHRWLEKEIPPKKEEIKYTLPTSHRWLHE